MIETKYEQPSEEDLESIYTQVYEDISKCQGDYHWTTWNSVSTPNENDGNDFESLEHHQLCFK